MATLASKTSSGILSFDKYVKGNKNLAATWFRIEDGIQGFMYLDSFMTSQIPTGADFRIVSDQVHDIYSKRCAKVNWNNVTGYIPLNQIRKPTQRNSTRYEDLAVTNITGFIGDLEVAGKSYFVDGVVKVDSVIKARHGLKHDPKADIILTNNGRPAVYISHKKEGDARAFQQYSGISSANEFIHNHPETISFIESLADAYSSGMTGSAFRAIEDPKLKMAAVYGNDYGAAFSLNHVHVLGQGHPIIVLEDNIHKLRFSSHMSGSGDALEGDYEPIFGATFRSGRVTSHGDTRVQNARAGIYPCAFLNGRKNLKVL